MLSTLHTTIVARLTPDLPGVSVAAYPKLERRVTLPAVLVDLEELEPDDFGEGAFDCWARFTAYCICDPNAAGADLAVRNLAATVAVRIKQEEDFGTTVERQAEVLRVAPDAFRPDLDGYLVWAVEFRIGLALGETVWSANPAAGVSVATITVGDLNSAYTDKQLVSAAEPEAADLIDLPSTPKG
jgi:hypothetical protein